MTQPDMREILDSPLRGNTSFYAGPHEHVSTHQLRERVVREMEQAKVTRKDREELLQFLDRDPVSFMQAYDEVMVQQNGVGTGVGELLHDGLALSRLSRIHHADTATVQVHVEDSAAGLDAKTGATVDLSSGDRMFFISSRLLGLHEVRKLDGAAYRRGQKSLDFRLNATASDVGLHIATIEAMNLPEPEVTSGELTLLCRIYINPAFCPAEERVVDTLHVNMGDWLSEELGDFTDESVRTHCLENGISVSGRRIKAGFTLPPEVAEKAKELGVLINGETLKNDKTRLALGITDETEISTRIELDDEEVVYGHA